MFLTLIFILLMYRRLAWTRLHIWEKNKKKIGVGKKKKSAREASQEVVWGGERVVPPFPLPRLPLGLLQAPIFFLFDPVFCLFPPLLSLAPG